MIVISSIYTDQPIFRVSPEAGWLPANLFLPKPVDPARLLEEVRRLTETISRNQAKQPPGGGTMKILKIPKQNLDLFAASSAGFRGGLCPGAARDNGFAFDRPSRWSDVRMNYPRTILPPKKFMLPPRETTFCVRS